MTTVELLRRLWRRWYVIVLGVSLTGLVAAGLMSSSPVFVSRVDVVLVAPREAAASRELVSSEENLIALAGLVERLVNQGRPRDPETSQVVPLEGTGVERGVQVTLPNSGGQWDYSFVSPVLDVQVVAGSPGEVVTARDRTLALIGRTLRETQLSDRVPPERLVTLRVVPEDGPVLPADGHPSRATGAAVAVGLFLTCLAALLLDHLLVRRRDRRRTAA